MLAVLVGPLERILALAIRHVMFTFYFTIVSLLTAIAAVRLLLVLQVYTANALYRKCEQILPKKKLHGLVPNFYIHVSVSVLYVLTISLQTQRQQNRQTNCGNV
jgi:hypothetical protein